MNTIGFSSLHGQTDFHWHSPFHHDRNRWAVAVFAISRYLHSTFFAGFPNGKVDARGTASRKRRIPKSIDLLAVLPLLNASGDPSTDYLSDGITESIINSLSRLPKLRVMARSTVFRYKGTDADPHEIGRYLGVRALVTGSVLLLDDSLVVKVEMVDLGDGSQVWGNHYNRKVSDILVVQEEISKEITKSLRF